MKLLFLSVLLRLCLTQQLPDSNPSSFAVAARSELFFSFQVKTGEGWNLLRDVLLRVLHMVDTTAKNNPEIQFTLVLPQVCRLPHLMDYPDGGCAWGRFIDKEELNAWAKFKVIDFDEYSQKFGPRFTQLWSIQRLRSLQNIQEYMESITCSEERKAIVTREATRCMPISAPVHCFDAFFFSASRVFQDQLVKVASSGASNSVFFVGAQDMGWDPWFSTTSQYLDGSVCHVFPSQYFVWEAARFIADTICQSDKECPFIGIHLRRRDFLYAHPDATPGMDLVAKQINRVATREQIFRVFIATDSQEDAAALRSLVLPSITIAFYSTPPSPYVWNSLDSAVVEQTILISSSYFIGSLHSTYSRAVTDLRDCGFLNGGIPYKKRTTYNALCQQPDQDCSLHDYHRRKD